MNRNWMTWVLAGALAASVQWNLGGFPSPADPSQRSAQERDLAPWRGGTGTSPLGGEACGLDAPSLGLTPEQSSQLADACRSSCNRAADSEAEASRKLDHLRELLGGSDLDAAEVRQLVKEVSELREQALSDCVDSVLEVRRVLQPEQVKALLSACCRTPEADH